MTLISARVSACDFVVKFSPSVCVAVVAYLTGDVAARSVIHGTAESDKSCCYPWFVNHNKTSNAARSGSPPDDISSTSTEVVCAGTTGVGLVWLARMMWELVG